LPQSGDWGAWSRWGRENPGLTVAAAASLLAAGFVIAGLVSRPPAPRPTSAPVPSPAPSPLGVQTPAIAPSPSVGQVVPAPGPAASDPRDVVIPPPARPNVVIEQTVPAEAPRAPKRPAESGRGDGGWYVKR
jgi:hypothetical protein